MKRNKSEDEFERYEATRQRLLRHDFPRRGQVARGERIEPFSDGQGNMFANPYNLKLILFLTKDPSSILTGVLVRTLRWETVQVKAVLRWGIREGILEQLSNNRFAYNKESEFLSDEDFQLPTARPAEGEEEALVAA